MKPLHKMGDTRADGFRFLSYDKFRGRFRERWASPERFERHVGFIRKYWKTYRRKRP